MPVDPATFSLLIVIAVTTISKVILDITKRFRKSSCTKGDTKIDIEMNDDTSKKDET